MRFAGRWHREPLRRGIRAWLLLAHQHRRKLLLHLQARHLRLLLPRQCRPSAALAEFDFPVQPTVPASDRATQRRSIWRGGAQGEAVDLPNSWWRHSGRREVHSKREAAAAHHRPWQMEVEEVDRSRPTGVVASASAPLHRNLARFHPDPGSPRHRMRQRRPLKTPHFRLGSRRRDLSVLWRRHQATESWRARLIDKPR